MNSVGGRWFMLACRHAAYVHHPSDGTYDHTGSLASNPIMSNCSPNQERRMFVPGGS
jgi:hypothetical protein